MIKTIFLSILLQLATLSGWAAELPVGDWTGRYCFAKDDPLQATYQVQRLVSEREPEVVTWAITMNAAGVEIAFRDILLKDGQLSFVMNPGEEVFCLLSLGEGGVYKGECSSQVNPGEAQIIKVFMRPPVVAEQIEAEEVEPGLDGDEDRPEAQ